MGPRSLVWGGLRCLGCGTSDLDRLGWVGGRLGLGFGIWGSGSGSVSLFSGSGGRRCRTRGEAGRGRGKGKYNHLILDGDCVVFG